MRNPLLAGASSFAHFAGIGRRRADADDTRDDDRGGRKSRRAADDDDDKDRDDKDGKKSRRAEDDDRDDKDGKDGKKSRRAADDDDDKDRDDKDGKKSRRASDDDDDEDDDSKDEMNGRGASANARRRERARCAAIFGCRAAADNVQLAASLAFETTMTRREAIAVLKGQAGRGDDRAHDLSGDRSARNPRLGPGGDRDISTETKAATAWDGVLAKVGVPARK